MLLAFQFFYSSIFLFADYITLLAFLFGPSIVLSCSSLITSFFLPFFFGSSIVLSCSSLITSSFLPFFFGFPLDFSCSELQLLIISCFFGLAAPLFTSRYNSIVLSSSSLITSRFLPFFFGSSIVLLLETTQESWSCKRE